MQSQWDQPIPDARDPELTALSFLERCKKERARQKPLLEQAEYRERYVLGEQWVGHTDAIAQQILADDGGDRILAQENMLDPLSETWSARIDQGRVDPRVAPHDSEAGDVSSAEAGNMLLDALKQKNHERALVSQAAGLAQYHGDVLFYPTWDEMMTARVRRQAADELGLRFDPITGAPVYEEVEERGEVRLEVISALEYWDSGEDDEKRAKWRVVERPLDEDTAQALIGGVLGEDAPDPKMDSATSATGIEWRGVYAYEIWCTPGAIHPKGFYALVVGGVPLRVEVPYPYAHGELPGSVWKIQPVARSPRGRTHIARAIHQQRMLNNAVHAILMRVVVAKDCALVGNSRLLDQWRVSGKKRIVSDNKDHIESLRFVEGPDIPGSLFAAYDRWKAALHDTFGVSNATQSGGDPSETNSGKQLREATALDAQKIAGPRARLEQCLERCARQMLSLAIQKYDHPRLVRNTGANGETRARYLSAADLKGADLLVEIGGGALNTRLAGQREAEESAQAGYASPKQAAERRETGLAETVDQGQTRARVDAQARQALEGRPQEPMRDVDPAAAADHLRAVAHSPLPGGAQMQHLLELLARYEELARERTQGPGKPPMAGGEQGGKAGATKIRSEAMRAPTTIQ